MTDETVSFFRLLGLAASTILLIVLAVTGDIVSHTNLTLGAILSIGGYILYSEFDSRRLTVSLALLTLSIMLLSASIRG